MPAVQQESHTQRSQYAPTFFWFNAYVAFSTKLQIAGRWVPTQAHRLYDMANA